MAILLSLLVLILFLFYVNGEYNKLTSTSFEFGMENPFTLKVGQVFTGFGIGCGIGIGVGRPLNLGAIPALQQVMSATRGATDAFSGVGRHLNGSFRRLGMKRIEAGVGCGVGLGHGFGVGIAIKPGVVQRIQSCLMQTTIKMMTKLGMLPSLPGGSSAILGSLNSSIGKMGEISDRTSQSQLGSIMQLATKTTEIASHGLNKDGNFKMESKLTSTASKGTPSETPIGTRTEKVLSSFLQSPVMQNVEQMEVDELARQVRSENNVLQMLLKHQQVIEELMKENDKLRRVLVEDLKISQSKLQSSTASLPKLISSPCSDCFECRRRQRKSVR